MSFSSDLRKIANKARGNIDQVARKVAGEAFSSIIMMTPVHEGRARGNWSAGVGEYSTTPDEKKIDKSGAATIAAAQAVANSAGAGKIIYLTNSLPYIRPLEFGSSKKAPAGMVRVTAERFETFVSDAARAVK